MSDPRSTVRVVHSTGRTTASTKLSDRPDEELIKIMSKDGNMQAFGVLYDRYSDIVLNRAWGLVGKKDQAEDLCHDIFLKLFTNCSKYLPERSFAAWFSVLSYNVVMDTLRKKSRHTIVSTTDMGDELTEVDDSVALLQEKKVLELRVDKLEAALKQLPSEERGILLMKYQDDLGVKDISGILKIGDSAVKMRLMRARRHLLEIHEQ